VLETCKKLESSFGAEVVYVDMDDSGSINVNQIKENMNDSTILVSIMAVNNELGTVAPLKDIGEIVKAKEGVLFHTDGVQAYGKIPIEIEKWGVDLVSLSGHKIHGPKGVGGLYLRKGINIEPYTFGGGQEKGIRSGTENTPGIVGFGEASRIMKSNFDEATARMSQVRNYLLAGIKAEISDIRINSPEKVYSRDTAEGSDEPLSSPGILNVSFLGCPGEVMLHFLEQKEIFISTGSACSSKKKGSRVLKAAGLPSSAIESALRFSFSQQNTIEEMDYVLVELKRNVAQIRKTIKRR
jgi:cysteine desulfurase